ncbi:ATP synthase-coupling factor 6, mitochondrial [Ixodes scapularis]|uniref:ATP synthase-coupling factor 6, mitochondrial n=2 Tax=Ixodes TaxID=6944 RepID=B7PRH9_IXOSC|nr:ATP synthase-coupling factor 6, mitochondrial [Ixodes scapularis]EEC09201.1 F1F0 ATP-synthase subunit Cf6, putative [Ixodes scapularis]|eukprot:XP_002399676.1 F1F0 ATP-synthase subunit Cf6, putative [Ixodes scapularis]
MALNGKLHALATQCISHCRRNYGISAVLMQKSLDPVQKLFVDKLREYAQKSKSKSELFVDADEKIKMEYNDELKKAAVQFGGDKGSDMSKFPDFQFEDPQLDPINLEKK